MRLIDADRLLTDKMKSKYYHLPNGDIAIPLIDIEHAPTIESERKTGRWIKKTIKKKIENDYSCSECGRHVSLMKGYDVRMVYPFCHCGAEMEDEG